MKTVFVTYDADRQKHYLTSWSDSQEVHDQIPASLWDGARGAIRLALAAGQLMSARGDRFEFQHGGETCAVVVEGVR